MSRGRDRLTGLLDRDAGYASAGTRVAESHIGHLPLAVLWIDIDRFRSVNHSFGHQGGDCLVKAVADRLGTVIGSQGDLARMSGDEFAVVLPATSLEAATDMARLISRAIADPLEIDRVPIHPTASIGIAMLEPDEDAVRLLLRADKAKTIAKQAGGNRWSVSGERLSVNGYGLAREELEIEAKLHVAIDTGGLQLHYQPIVRRDGTVAAVEALMRCNVNGESIPPAKLIPVAEKTGLITRLGEWTLAEGACFARQLMDAGFGIKVAVNVSRAQLLSPTFVQALHSALVVANIPPQFLELELTESLFLDATPTVQDNLRGVCNAGVSLAIDDFGTGYSSLASLKDVPASKVKLDRSFIVVLPDDWKAFAVVRAMANLGRELGMTVVAEGIETEAQRACLEELQVDAVQGYLYSPPIPIGKLFTWLRALRDNSPSPLLI